LPQRKGVRQRNKTPINQLRENPTPKQDGWWAYTADFQNLKTSHTSLREELTKQLPLKDWKKNW
jgi:hypothetical protein